MSAFTWILVGILGFVIVMGLIGFFYLIRKRLKREERGDVFLMNKNTKDGSPPIEIRAQRDYRYKDAGVDPYKKSE